jgi:hypothetical protein
MIKLFVTNVVTKARYLIGIGPLIQKSLKNLTFGTVWVTLVVSHYLDFQNWMPRIHTDIACIENPK